MTDDEDAKFRARVARADELFAEIHSNNEKHTALIAQARDVNARCRALKERRTELSSGVVVEHASITHALDTRHDIPKDERDQMIARLHAADATLAVIRQLDAECEALLVQSEALLAECDVLGTQSDAAQAAAAQLVDENSAWLAKATGTWRVTRAKGRA